MAQGPDGSKSPIMDQPRVPQTTAAQYKYRLLSKFSATLANAAICGVTGRMLPSSVEQVHAQLN